MKKYLSLLVGLAILTACQPKDNISKEPVNGNQAQTSIEEDLAREPASKKEGFSKEEPTDEKVVDEEGEDNKEVLDDAKSDSEIASFKDLIDVHNSINEDDTTSFILENEDYKIYLGEIDLTAEGLSVELTIENKKDFGRVFDPRNSMAYLDYERKVEPTSVENFTSPEIGPGESASYKIYYPIAEDSDFNRILVLDYFYSDDMENLDPANVKILSYGLGINSANELERRQLNDGIEINEFITATVYGDDEEIQAYLKGSHMGNPSDFTRDFWDETSHYQDAPLYISGAVKESNIEYAFMGPMRLRLEDGSDLDYMLMSIFNEPEESFSFNPADIKLYALADGESHSVIADDFEEDIAVEPYSIGMIDLAFEGNPIDKKAEGFILILPEKYKEDGSIYRAETYIKITYRENILPQYEVLTKEEAEKLMNN